jgi:hypothetical protein
LPDYTIERIETESWDPLDPSGFDAFNELRVENFHPTSLQQPGVRVRGAYDATGLYWRFDVHDRFVRSVVREHNGPVCTDSCVEFFFQPASFEGYINIEANCGGTLHVGCSPTSVSSATPGNGSRPLPPEEIAGLVVRTSLPETVEPELPGPVDWWAVMTIPFSVVTSVTGASAPQPGDLWRGNFYKCGDRTSHPHWAAWADIGALRNFHQPERFGTLRFG